ncbi:MAG TPA: ABC transporter permease [Beijerinckiaceae bacterium]
MSARYSIPDSRFLIALADIKEGLANWRAWSVLALNDVRQRYRRSIIGQFWNTISMALTIAGVGVVFGVIMGEPFADYLAFFGIGLIVWTLIATLITDLSAAFIESALYLKSYPGPRSVVLFRVILRNLLISAHNFLLVPVLWLLASPPVNAALLLFLPGLLMCVFMMIWVGIVLGTLSARFRDVPPIVQSVTQLLFFLTPILYRPEQIRDRLPLVTHFNPFASLVEIMRAPLLGQVPELHHYLLVGVVTLVVMCVAVPFYSRFRARIAYWT